MTVPSDIPGYCQGFRFSDASTAFYNGSNRFIDQSPYADWDINHMDLLAGTPTFETVGGFRALRVDNSSHWDFLPAHGWEGSFLLVAKPTYVSGGTLTRYPILSGIAGTLSSNAALVLQHASGARRFTLQGATGAVTLIQSVSSDASRVVMFSTSQQNRRFYGSEGSAPTSTAEYVSNANSGSFLDLQYTNTSDSSRRRMLFGAMSGLSAGTTAQTDFYMHAYELHFWNEPVLLTHEADCLSLIADLKTAYGI